MLCIACNEYAPAIIELKQGVYIQESWIFSTEWSSRVYWIQYIGKTPKFLDRETIKLSSKQISTLNLQVIPFRSMPFMHISNTLSRNEYFWFEISDIFLSNNGQKFVKKCFITLCRCCRFERVMIVAYHPEAS